jgi:hypothetical protein
VTRFGELLRSLADANVEFILVALRATNRNEPGTAVISTTTT